MASLRVFVSHCDKDHAWCDAFVAGLKSRGLEVWYDRQLQYVGAQWAKKIEEELDGRAVFLMVLTPDAWAAPSVLRELGQALKQRKQIVGVLHKMTQLSSFILARCQLIDATKEDGQHAGLIVGAALNGAHATFWPLRASGQVPPAAPAGGPPDISGVWVAAENSQTRLALSQSGAAITGTGTHWLLKRVTIAGSMTGDSVTLKLTPAEKDAMVAYCELHLTRETSGKLAGHIRYV